MVPGSTSGCCLDTSPRKALGCTYPQVWPAPPRPPPLLLHALPPPVSKGLPERPGLPPALHHVIFICLIKANLIKAGIAEMRKSPSEPRSWPDAKRGPLSPCPQAVTSRAPGHPGEWAEEARPRGASLWIHWTPVAAWAVCKQPEKREDGNAPTSRGRRSLRSGVAPRALPGWGLSAAPLHFSSGQ